VVLAEPSGPGHGVGIVAVPECFEHRLAPASASVRFVNATGDLGAAVLRAGGTATGVTDPFTASEAVVTAAGPTTLTLANPASGETYLQRPAQLDADRAYLVLAIGAGEQPLDLVTYLTAEQPKDPPPGDMPVNTGVARRPRPTGATIVPTKAVAAPATPVHVDIPTIGVDADVVPYASGEVAALAQRLDGVHVAWLDGSDRPGDLGIAVLVGHVAFGARAVFADLDRLRRGDQIAVTDTDGAVRRFAVSTSVVMKKGAIPDDAYAPVWRPTLFLVSCTGPLDPATGLHRDNLLVSAVVVP
jgi:hypothetical protein